LKGIPCIPATVSLFPYMQFLLCLCFRVIDRPRRTRLAVRASSKISNEHSTASACFSNSNALSSGRRFNSQRRPAAAAAVQVRSHAGCGLFSFIKEHIVSTNKHLKRGKREPQMKEAIRTNKAFSSP